MATVEQIARDKGGKIVPLRHALRAEFSNNSAASDFMVELERRGIPWTQTREGVEYSLKGFADVKRG